MKPIIFALITQGGLCNRMRVMASVLEISREKGVSPFFIWVKMPDMNASFKDLFKMFPATVINLNRRGLVFKVIDFIKKHWPGIIVDDEYVCRTFKKEKAEWKSVFQNNNLLIHTCENITNTTDLSSFIPEDRICERNYVQVNNNMVGIHIRRTDNEKSRLFSPTKAFVKAMEDELKSNPNTSFYLATDDSSEEEYLKQIFGEKIVVYKKRTINRNDPKGVEDALIDLINLSNCRKIIGSYYSSFSDLAAYWKGIEKIVIMEKIS